MATEMRLLSDQPITAATDDGFDLDAIASALEALIAGRANAPFSASETKGRLRGTRTWWSSSARSRRWVVASTRSST
jgi:hypothetical protein